MKIFQNIALEVAERWFTGTGWKWSFEHGDATEGTIGFHYHDVEEWLLVTAGRITFITAGGIRNPLVTGDVLQIPRGEIHDVEIGPEGVEYHMWMPVAVPESEWQNKLSDEEMDLVRMNLAVNESEVEEPPLTLRTMLPDRFTFVGVDGEVLGREEVIKNSLHLQSESTGGSVRVLHRTPRSLLLSVSPPEAGARGTRQSITSLRLFVRDGDALKCLLWMNYPVRG